MNNAPLLIAFILLGLGFLIPNHFSPWLSWQNEIVVFAAILLMAATVVYKDWQQRSSSLRMPVLALVPLGLALLALVQWAVGLMVYGGDVLVVLSYALLCCMCVSIGYAQTSECTRKANAVIAAPAANALAWTLLLAAALTAYILLLQNFLLESPALSWAASNNILGYARPGGYLSQANHAATLQLLGMASLLFLHARGRLSAPSSAALLLLLGIGMTVTQSRTSVLSLVALLLWWAWKQPQLTRRIPRWVGLTISALIVALFMSWPKLFNWVHMMGSGEGAQVRGLSDVRSQVWPQLAQAVWQKPWLGWGINQTATAHSAIADRYPPTTAFTYSHNVVLDMALWVGLPLTAILVLLAAVWLWRRARSVQNPLAWYGLALALPVAVHSMLEFPFTYAYFLAPMMLGLGFTEGALGGRSLRLNGKVAAAILLISGAALAYSAIEYVRVEDDFRTVRFESLNLGQTPATYEAPKTMLLTQLGAQLTAFRLKAKPDMSLADLRLLRAVAAQSANATISARYALSLALNGQRIQAERELIVIRAQYGEQNHLAACLSMQAALSEHKIDWRPNCNSKEPAAD